MDTNKAIELVRSVNYTIRVIYKGLDKEAKIIGENLIKPIVCLTYKGYVIYDDLGDLFYGDFTWQQLGQAISDKVKPIFNRE